MKKIYNMILWLSGVALGSGLQSCVSEDPFDNGSEGMLNIRTEIKSEIKTRAENLTDNRSLRDKCVVYIESNKGVVRKFIGLDNVPLTPISLKQGHYVAEAWTGDSVSASFDAKFYRGKEEFEIQPGDNLSLLLKCNIANVITSVNQDALQLEIKNLKVTFSHSRGSLTFTEQNIPTDKGYFMMPNADKDLEYTVTGEASDGTQIMRSGKIENVQRAHEYVMNLTVDNEDQILGGGLIRIKIEDIPVIEDTIDIYGRPTVMGDGFDIDEQIVGSPAAVMGTADAFTDKVVYIRCYDGIFRVQLSECPYFDNLGMNVVNIVPQDNVTKTQFEEMGITWDGPTDSNDAVTGKYMQEMRLIFKKKFFDNLPLQDSEYKVQIYVADYQKPYNKSTTKELRIANTPEAVIMKAPVETVAAPDPVSEPMAILAHSATLRGAVGAEVNTEYGIRYRKQGDSEWISVPANATRAGASSQFTVTISGLQPGTTYEYKSYEEGYDDCEVMTFTTESYFTIPNTSFEQWSSYQASTMLGTKNVTLPWSEGNKSASYWGSGNEGAATANMTLTDKSTDMVHSGAYSARLESKSALGMLAAGNIFVGEYVRTDGTNGVLSLGRNYNGSHPSKLSVWANYRPGSGITVKNEPAGGLPEGFSNGKDHGQIYVALTTEPVEIRTNQSNLKVFDPNDPVVVGYGQVTWTDNFGPDGGLQQVEIPITYNNRAASTPATHLVIVVSASKYGDYFTGAPGSVMYLDDFELVYE
ncbi:MAG: PCMD domain-containing protein [Muribaculaceae bacterium]|nr:PCMD domain-containing protein [Muribaculaceae bacterium]